jgi:flagellar capping protein FliD
VSDLFNAEGGIANQFYDYVDGVTDSIDGAISYRTKSLESIVRDISDEIEAAEARLEDREESLIKQFARLEAIMSNYSTQASYLAGLLTTSG